MYLSICLFDDTCMHYALVFANAENVKHQKFAELNLS